MTVFYIHNEYDRNEIMKIKINVVHVGPPGEQEQRVRIQKERIVSTSAGMRFEDCESIVLTMQRYEQFRTITQRWKYWNESKREEALQRLEDNSLSAFIGSLRTTWRQN
ncbi:Oidioi.mRNA.OKI2018_I69.PAR.g11491.t1.cds [Oikopleura dioica]|uniref:Oidioi.mRNA.OKI2018_I69.PAR.g11491.t1.cds n=1 Tax=Oikopleura dioica TaxID=34765 RepID=A0ABN7S1N2_OIKDI|nr:Oidioi.mRNA.OKI2018_I69.PAR.g11491.t1.cds [Oikopleura dioica]